MLVGRAVLTGKQSAEALLFRSHISVVDDDHSFRDSMRRLLKSLDYSVTTFPSAAQFLASPEFGTTACLVADIQMPEMTGVALYEHLLEKRRPIPTILVTAYPVEVVRERMMSLGVICYLPKPFLEAELIHCLELAFIQRQTHHA